MKEFEGSVLSKDHFEKLQKAKQYLEVIKSYKLELRDEKNARRGPMTLRGVLDHIEEERGELKVAFETGDANKIIEELADLINCSEIMAMMVLY